MAPEQRAAEPQMVTPEEKNRGVVCRTRNIECIFKDRGGSLLLMSFNEMGMRANGSAIWADVPAEKLGLSIVGFVTTEPNWFPEADLMYCLSCLQTAIGSRFKQRVAIGMSQGGYAAIKYNISLNAKTVIAFSPQVSIDQRDIEDTRFNQYFRSELHANMAINELDSGGDVYMFFDPYDEGDARHCAMIAKKMVVTEIRLPFAGHGSIRPFAGTEYLEELLKHCITKNIQALSNLYHRVKARNKSRPFLITLALAEKHPHLAYKIFEKYKTGEPFLDWRHAAYRLAMAGKGEQVFGWIKSVADQHYEHVEVQACMARIALEMGDREAGKPYIERALRARPNDPSFLWLSRKLAENTVYGSR